jgi:DNA-binding FrmR family transcriptional regulator
MGTIYYSNSNLYLKSKIYKNCIMNQIKLKPDDKKAIATSTKKVIGQLQSILTIIEEDRVTDSTFNQLLAVKGGASRICKEIISKGVLANIQAYSPQELDHALDIIFRLDK